MTSNFRLRFHNKKRFIKTLYGLELFKFLFDYLQYRKNLILKKIAMPDAVYSYKIPMANIYVKSPSLRLLKLMKIRYLNNYYLDKQKRYFQSIGISDKATIIDIGANIGYYSLMYSLIMPGSDIFSFEPSRVNFSYLRYHANQRKNIQVYNYGFHDKKEVVDIQMPSSVQNPSTLRAKDNTGLLSIYGISGDHSEAIELVTLDEKVINEKIINKPISFIKIDVEGNELRVLKGAKRTLDLYKPILEIELNRHALLMADTNPEAIIQLMKDEGYLPHIYKDGKIQLLSKMVELVQNVVFLPKKRI